MVKRRKGKARKRVLYVEGGGDHNTILSAECRRAFQKLFENAGLQSKPRVISCGGRSSAFDQFRRAHLRGDEEAWLLVDSEDVVVAGPPFDPWGHVARRQGDRWERPSGAKDEQLHLMAVCMETWLSCDREAWKRIFPRGLDQSKLPKEDGNLERRSKVEILGRLREATENTPSGGYGKGSHSFRLLALVRADRLRRLSWGARFLDAMS